MTNTAHMSKKRWMYFYHELLQINKTKIGKTEKTGKGHEETGY